MTFGEFTRNGRKVKGIKLRKFCKEIGVDPGNWVRVEKGVSCAPRDLKLLQKIASILDITDTKPDELNKYYQLAARTFIPEELREKI